MIALGQALPRPPLAFWPWVVVGALAQIVATALMLAAMNDRSFVVVYAYIKTEPVQVAAVRTGLPRRGGDAGDGGGDRDRHRRAW